MVSGQYVAGLAAVLSGLTLLPILFGGFFILNEINSFYDESMTDLQEFRVRKMY